MSLTIKRIVMNAAVAALYVVLTFISGPFAFLDIQFRISEMLMLLCFFRKDYTIGLTIGCFLANLGSPMLLDCVIGTSATLIACLAICFTKHLLVAAIMPVLANGVIVGLELTYLFKLETTLIHNMLFVAIGELVVMIVGYILFLIIFKREKILKLFDANQNLSWKF